MNANVIKLKQIANKFSSLWLVIFYLSTSFTAVGKVELSGDRVLVELNDILRKVDGYSSLSRTLGGKSSCTGRIRIKDFQCNMLMLCESNEGVLKLVLYMDRGFYSFLLNNNIKFFKRLPLLKNIKKINIEIIKSDEIPSKLHAFWRN